MVSGNWNAFQQQFAGRGLSCKAMAELYRRSAGCPSQALLLLAPKAPSAQGATAPVEDAPFFSPPFSSGLSKPSQTFTRLRSPNLGYACCNQTLRNQNPSVYITRTTTNTCFQKRGASSLSA